MNPALYAEIIGKHKGRLRSLREKKILLIADCIKGGLLDDPAFVQKNSEFFTDADILTFTKLLCADIFDAYPHPALIDFRKALDVYRTTDVPEDECIKTALLMSRVNFMGTDGIRGKVVLEPSKDCLCALLQDNAFSPALVETTSFSFGVVLIEQGVLGEGDTVVIGNDGRDLAYGWKLNRAVIDGFGRARLNVLDIGIVPTALVPSTMLRKGLRGGAMLTASHNPSNQNGIKFFIDGKKLLPEGPLGDYALSSRMYTYSRLLPLPEKRGSAVHAEVVARDGERLILSALPENAAALLKETILVLDTANGAFSEIAAKVLDTLGVTYSTKNETPTGANINRGCGVAEIEGTERFEGGEYNVHIPFVKELFDKGRVNEAGKVYGIALDGDGDRGFLLFYDKENDCVHVIDGDKSGYLLAEYLIKVKNVDPKGRWFISTIESDLMTAASAEKELGLRTKVVSVGDKWIGNFSEGPILVGVEISGHLIFPIRFKNEAGSEVTLLSGIGLLTGLMALIAIKALRLEPAKIIEPFEPGLSHTYYVYFVDKAKFYRNSALWAADCALVRTEVEAFKKSGALPASTKLTFDEKEDPNVLYATLRNGDGLLGCVFMRNSGTEDKASIYVKGRREFGAALLALGALAQEHHIGQMKNERRIEYVYEKLILNALQKNAETGFADIKVALEKETKSSISESDLLSVVHGLRKEGRVVTRQAGGATFLRRA
jgi:phosphoglucosamine mutase